MPVSRRDLLRCAALTILHTWPASARTVAPVSVGLVCLAAASDKLKPLHFWLNFSISDRTWYQGEPFSTSDVFSTKRGRFRRKSGRMVLLGSGSGPIAELPGLRLLQIKDGDEGENGFAEESGRHFTWKVAIVML